MPHDNSTPVTIDLGNGNIVIVDAEDVDRVLSRNWYRSRGKDRPDYMISQKGPRGAVVTVYLHRFILDAPKGSIVDHINGDTMDNRRSSNLRFATPTQNNANASKRSTNPNTYKGVRLRHDGKKWCARIQINGKGIHLGSFETQTEAARAYDLKALEIFSEFAVLNFPDEHDHEST